MKKYTYKGYVFYRTDTTTTVRYQRGLEWLERPMHVYEIEGLKPAGKRPFLTTMQACRDYIDSVVEGLPPVRGDVPRRIQAARSQRAMAQRALGAALGYTGDSARVVVCQWEAGTRPVPMNKIRPPADLLHIEAVSLLP